MNLRKPGHTVLGSRRKTGKYRQHGELGQIGIGSFIAVPLV
jgi:hypothetical protein